MRFVWLQFGIAGFCVILRGILVTWIQASLASKVGIAYFIYPEDEILCREFDIFASALCLSGLITWIYLIWNSSEVLKFRILKTVISAFVSLLIFAAIALSLNGAGIFK
jgi:hypothetical protein